MVRKPQILRNSPARAQLSMHQERKMEYTLPFLSPPSTERSCWQWSQKNPQQCRRPCTPLLPGSWTGERAEERKEVSLERRGLWGPAVENRCLSEKSRSRNYSIQLFTHLNIYLSTPGLPPKGKPSLSQVHVLQCAWKLEKLTLQPAQLLTSFPTE